MSIPLRHYWTYAALALAIGWALTEALSLALHPLLLDEACSIQDFESDRRLAPLCENQGHSGASGNTNTSENDHGLPSPRNRS